mgnify:CR=1 FL=1
MYCLPAVECDSSVDAPVCWYGLRTLPNKCVAYRMGAKPQDITLGECGE